ncbi:hypothetical protein [Gilvimarinus chinensis]|uniref:hypothetical protein n=1 Tax=Gilvimarinus chinensis TaxID=396005 RepID=UPI000382379A|nr:hypothetical protein [Gilvimarinus chinensis]
MDENTYLLNRHLDEQERLEREYQNRLIGAAALVEQMAIALLYEGVRTFVGSKAADRDDIKEEVLRERNLREAMNEWRYNSNRTPIDDLVFRAASRLCALSADFDLVDLNLDVTAPKVPLSAAEIESYAQPIECRIDDYLNRKRPTVATAKAKYTVPLKVFGRTELFTGWGQTIEEAESKAIALMARSKPISREDIAA